MQLQTKLSSPERAPNKLFRYIRKRTNYCLLRGLCLRCHVCWICHGPPHWRWSCSHQSFSLPGRQCMEEKEHLMGLFLNKANKAVFSERKTRPTKRYNSEPCYFCWVIIVQWSQRSRPGAPLRSEYFRQYSMQSTTACNLSPLILHSGRGILVGPDQWGAAAASLTRPHCRPPHRLSRERGVTAVSGSSYTVYPI